MTTLTTDTIWTESRAAWERTGVARPDVVAAFLGEHDNAAEYLKSIRHDTVTRPVIYLGAGTCGLGAGAGKTREAIRKYLAEKKMDAEFIEVGCIGLCVEEPLVDVQLPGKARIGMRKVTADKAPELLDRLFAGTPDPGHVLWQFPQEGQEPWDGVQNFMDHPFFKPQTRWVLENCGVVDPVSIDEYIARGGYQALVTAIRTMTPAEVCEMIKASGLRGRGGGGFPTGLKWKLTLDTPGEQKYFICNADEGDPGAFMDRAVIEGDPYRLLEGLGIAAYGIGATKAYIYIRAEYPLAIERLRIAIAKAREYGLLGYNILDSGFNLEIKIKMGAGAFVCGEETALIHSIEGKRGMPRPRPPYPSVRGLFDKPTAINNVETLANVPAIVRNGVDWFTSLGTGSSKGTKVFALSGKITRTGLVEVAMGTTIRQIVTEIGDGCPNGKTFKAVQMGGPSGGCIPESHLDIQIDYESLKTVGAMMGSGGMVVMDEDTCMVDVAKFFMDFIQRESCGKCVPCREGTKAMLDILEQITKGRRSIKGDDALGRFKGVTNLTRLASVIQDTSLCGLGQSAPNPVLSTMRWFKDEYDAHIYERKCPAGACTDLLTFTIDTEKCIGCTLCARKCPADAIVGKAKTPHYIVQEKCIGCGSCIDACRVNAVMKE